MAQETSKYTDSSDLSLQKIEKDTSFSLGQYGAQYMHEAETTVGSFGAIQALENSVVNLSSSNWSCEDSTEDIPIPAGLTIFGNFSDITVNSGKILAYRNA